MPNENTSVVSVESVESTETTVENSTVESVADQSGTDVSLTEALGLSGLGVGIVFAVLIVLMAFITIMSAVIRGGKKEAKPVAVAEPKQSEPKAAAPAPAPVASASGDADMYVTLNGQRHAVSVEEKLPKFTVTLNGKAHAVDVEGVEEE